MGFESENKFLRVDGIVMVDTFDDEVIAEQDEEMVLLYYVLRYRK